MKYCTKCGHPLNDDDLFCSKCGAKQIVAMPQEQPNIWQELQDTQQMSPENEEPQTVEAVQVAPIQEETDISSEPEQEEVTISKEPTQDKPVFSLVCAQCGSTDIEMLSETQGRCNHCGTMLRIQDNKTYINNVNINIRGAGEVPLSYYKVMPDKSAKQFEKMAIVTLAKAESTPADIFEKSQFAPVATKIRKLVAFKGFVKVSYTVKVGTDMEKVVGTTTNSLGNVVPKKEKYIKWETISGEHEGEYTTCMVVDEYAESDVEFGPQYHLDDAIDHGAKMVPFDGQGITFNNQDKEAAKSTLSREASYEAQHNISADHVDDFRATYKVELTEITGYIIPEYTMDFTYSGEETPTKHKISAFAAGNLACYGNYPNHANKYEDKASTKNLLFVVPTLLMLLASIIVSFTVKSAGAIWGVFAGAVVLFIVSLITKRAFRKSTINDSLQTKLESAKSLLQKKGLN